MNVLNGVAAAAKWTAKTAHVVVRGAHAVATHDSDDLSSYTQIFVRGAAKALVTAEPDPRTLGELERAGVLEEFEQTAEMLADFVVPIVDELARTQAGNWAAGNAVAIRGQLYVIFLEVLNNLRKNVIDGRLGMADANGVFKTISDVISRDDQGKLDREKWAALGASMEELLLGDLLQDHDERIDGDVKRLLRPILIPGVSKDSKPEDSVLAMVLTSSVKAAMNEDLFVSMLGSMLKPYANKSLDQLLFGEKSFGELEARREITKALSAQSKQLKKLPRAQRKIFVDRAMHYADRWLASKDAKPLLERWTEGNRLADADRPVFEEQVKNFVTLSRFESFFESKLAGSEEDRNRMMELLRPWFDQAEVNQLALRFGAHAQTAEDKRIFKERLTEAKALLGFDPLMAKHVHDNLAVAAKLDASDDRSELEASVMQRMRTWLASDEGRRFALDQQNKSQQKESKGELNLAQRQQLQALLQRFAAGASLHKAIHTQLDLIAKEPLGLNVADDAARAKLIQQALPRVQEWLDTSQGQELVQNWNSKAEDQVDLVPLKRRIRRELQTAQVELALEGRLESFLKSALDKFLPEQVRQLQAQELQRSARRNFLVGLATRLNKDVDQLLSDFDDGTLSTMIARRLAPQLVDGMREQLPALFGAKSFEDLKGKHIATFAMNQLRGALDVNFELRQEARSLLEELTTLKRRARDDYEDGYDADRFEEARQATHTLITEQLKPNQKVDKQALATFKRQLSDIDTEHYMEEGVLQAQVDSLVTKIEANEVPETRVNRVDVLIAARRRVGFMIRKVNKTDLSQQVKRTLIQHLKNVINEDLAPTRSEGNEERRQSTDLLRLDQAIRAMRLYGLGEQLDPLREELQQMRETLLPVLQQDERRDDLQQSLSAVLGKLGPVTAASSEKQLVGNLVRGILQFVGWWLGNLLQTFFIDLRERFGIDMTEQRRRMSEKRFEFKVRDSETRVQNLARDLIDKPTDELKEERLHNALHYLLVARA